METIRYPDLQETLYYERLDNGMDVYVLPKEGFQKTYATFTTKYGSVDNRFHVAGKGEMRVPDGVAHFLEHKMFEEPEGDIFAKFASQGASANAFTSFDRTAYLFSATESVLPNLETLINFVQNPYFTDENVEKEKGIISQEINMYRDNPDWRSYYGLIEAMYQVHPIHIDIAGTVESIREITKETLYDCYNTFYHPANMLLFVVGGVQPQSIVDLVKANQAAKPYPPAPEIVRRFDPEPESIRTPLLKIQLPVSLPKVLIGFKEPKPELAGDALLERELCTKVMLDALFSPSSAIYQKLYDEQVISDSFGHEYNIAGDYAFSIVGGDTKDPQLLMSRVKEELSRALESGIDAADFERTRKKRIGGFLRMLNSPESIANEFTKYRFKQSDLFRILPVYEKLTLEDVNTRLRDHVNFERMAVSIVETGAQ